jgi:chlorite dismutase
MTDAEKAPAERQRQFVQFCFYRVDPAWRRLPAQEREAGRKEFAELVEEFAARIILRSYSLVGIRGDCDFLLWKVSYALSDFQEFGARANRGALGPYLTRPYCYLSMTRRSIYVDRHIHEGQEGARLEVRPGGSKYIFVYPFEKTRDWYRMTKAARQGMMDEHIAVGHRYPSVRLNTTYSYGLDDQEFVLAFETDKPQDFLDLVMALRETEASRYTKRDTPIFTAVQMGIWDSLSALG